MRLIVTACFMVMAAEAGAQMTARDSTDAEAARNLTKRIWVAAQEYYSDRNK